MDLKLGQPVPKLLIKISEHEEPPPELEEVNIVMYNSEKHCFTSTMNTAIKQEINDNSNNCRLLPVKQEIVDIKTEIEDTANNPEDMKAIEYEFLDLSVVKQETPDNEDNSFVSSISPSNLYHQSPRGPKKSFSCTVCPYKCSRRTYLTDHLRTHTRDKPYSCTFCDYKCATNSHMTRHLKTHSEEKPYSCTFCEFKSSWKECLNYHLKAHVNEKPHSCNLCNYKSVKKSNLIRHMARHTRDKPHNCTICDYKCSRKSELVEHRKMHTGEKLYNCSLCDFKSSRKKSLNCHFLTHAAVKPYGCQFCDYKCSEKDSLTSHLKTHTIDKTNGTFKESSGNDVESSLNVDLERDRSRFDADDDNFETVKVEELYIKEEF